MSMYFNDDCIELNHNERVIMIHNTKPYASHLYSCILQTLDNDVYCKG